MKRKQKGQAAMQYIVLVASTIGIVLVAMYELGDAQNDALAPAVEMVEKVSKR